MHFVFTCMFQLVLTVSSRSGLGLQWVMNASTTSIGRLHHQQRPSSSFKPSELEAALLRCGALEGELGQLKREHERTTAKLSHLLKKRGGGAELAQLRQQVTVLQWREQQFKQALRTRGAPSVDQRPQQQPTAAPFHSRAGIPDTQPRFAAAARQASMPSRQITPPSPAPPSCGIKRTAPSDDSHAVRRCAPRITCPRRSSVLTPQSSSLSLAGQAHALNGSHDRDRSACAAAALEQPARRGLHVVWVHARRHLHSAARDQGPSRVCDCLETRVTVVPTQGLGFLAIVRWQCSSSNSGRSRACVCDEHGLRGLGAGACAHGIMASRSG